MYSKSNIKSYAQKHWSSQKPLPWCLHKGSNIFSFLSLLAEKDILKDYVTKTIETLDLLTVASRHLRDGSARFLLTFENSGADDLVCIFDAIRDATINIQDVSETMFLHLDPNIQQLLDALPLKTVPGHLHMELDLPIRSLTESINQNATIVPTFLIKFWINLSFLYTDAPISKDISELFDAIAILINQSTDASLVSEYLRLMGQTNVIASNMYVLKRLPKLQVLAKRLH